MFLVLSENDSLLSLRFLSLHFPCFTSAASKSGPETRFQSAGLTFHDCRRRTSRISTDLMLACFKVRRRLILTLALRRNFSISFLALALQRNTCICFRHIEKRCRTLRLVDGRTHCGGRREQTRERREASCVVRLFGSEGREQQSAAPAPAWNAVARAAASKGGAARRPLEASLRGAHRR